MKTTLLAMTAAALLLAACGAGRVDTVTRDQGGITTSDLNAYRAKRGRSGLIYSKKLERAAARHARDMARGGFRAHKGSDGSVVGQRVTQAGFKWCYVAENITWGRANAQKALAAWDASPAHRKTLLASKARHFGMAKSAGGVWVMVLAAPC